MIVLDTNVVSELLLSLPNPSVLRWARAARFEDFYITAITKGELLAGVVVMPHGERRETLRNAIENLLEQQFAGKMLPYDSHAARQYANVRSQRKLLGLPIKEADAQIAAICLNHDFSIATHNTGDFDRVGLSIINPWTD